ncbi:hypothetical protein CIRMBP1248_00089 [Enterococcus cecorum]|nr:hypothetical protein CIRMBP1229_00070 [Enterococcus cecorum]CAI3256425.1 hypothetical protein CIRMBP1248_00089 [Enterococcus cecorum]CAI3269056.1 hypothetical protein CIRMBP1227_00213 [Enterococcus cecorum]CAI3270489.1 hypothetical protein CIRMBP1260_00237 [Enterococcus cecorum]CAI3271351.1 hypothetical protein CIRMBP1211_00235 [Enterococcus cecorum]
MAQVLLLLLLRLNRKLYSRTIYKDFTLFDWKGA